MNRTSASRLAAASCGLGGLLLLGFGIAGFFGPQSSAPHSVPAPVPLVVPETDRDLGALKLNEESTVVFRILNPNDRPLRVLGAATT